MFAISPAFLFQQSFRTLPAADRLCSSDSVKLPMNRESPSRI